MSRLIGIVIFCGGSQLVACGPDCQSTCNKLYQESECGIERPGTTLTDRLSRCMDECLGAMEKPGELDGYDPLKEPENNSEPPTLDNDKQAAVWMDCVYEASCELLETQNVCAPVW